LSKTSQLLGTRVENESHGSSSESVERRKRFI